MHVVQYVSISLLVLALVCLILKWNGAAFVLSITATATLIAAAVLSPCEVIVQQRRQREPMPKPEPMPMPMPEPMPEPMPKPLMREKIYRPVSRVTFAEELVPPRPPISRPAVQAAVKGAVQGGLPAAVQAAVRIAPTCAASAAVPPRQLALSRREGADRGERELEELGKADRGEREHASSFGGESYPRAWLSPDRGERKRASFGGESLPESLAEPCASVTQAGVGVLPPGTKAAPLSPWEYSDGLPSCCPTTPAGVIRNNGLYGVKGDYNCDIMKRGAVMDKGFIQPIGARTEFLKYLAYDVPNKRDQWMARKENGPLLMS